MPRVYLDRAGKVRGYSMGLGLWLALRCLGWLLLAGLPFAVTDAWWRWLLAAVWAALVSVYHLGAWAEAKQAGHD